MQRKKLLVPRIKKEVAASHEGRKGKARGNGSGEECKAESSDYKSNEGEIGNDAEEVAKEDHERNKLEEKAGDQNEQNKLEEEADDRNKQNDLEDKAIKNNEKGSKEVCIEERREKKVRKGPNAS